MKKLIALIFIIPALFSCNKEKERYPDAEYVLQKWSKSIETLNYNDYRQSEAYPKESAVFLEMYKEYYLADIMVTGADKIDEKDVKKDHEGNSYIRRNIKFECTEIKRKNKKPTALIRGDVDFIRFVDGKRSSDGWLMSNRTLIRLEK